MIRWTFYFEEGGITRDIKSQEEDEHIEGYIEETDFLSNCGFLRVGTDEARIYIDIAKVKAITREILNEDGSKIEQKKEDNEGSQEAPNASSASLDAPLPV